MIEQYVQWAGLPSNATDVLKLAWECVPLKRAGETIGYAILLGTEIHFALAPEHRHRGIQRSRAREFLKPLIERYGFLTTRVWTDQEDRARFIERLGFQRTWTGDGVHHYMLSELPFGKEN